MNKLASISELEQFRKSVLENQMQNSRRVSICCGTGCRASGALEVVQALEKTMEEHGVKTSISTKLTGCHGFCEQGPLMVIYPENVLYCKVKTEDVEEIVQETFIKGNRIERLLYQEPSTGLRIAQEDQIPFYKEQKRLIMARNGQMDPTSLEDYLAVGGYKAVANAFKHMSQNQIIEEVKIAGLRGRGGGGFPTGTKWEICMQQESPEKYVICNADEGDPGCFQDRSLLEGNPYSILEGMTLGSFAVGASKGYIYVRHEYPLALSHLETAINQARRLGLLGENILGTGFHFDLSIFRGGGAFVCGEETALLSSIEGITGEPNPRPRPPYPAVSGLWGKPTVINNVKTWATVPLIIEHGGKWHSDIGTEKSKGTMIFSLTGRVRNTGLVEVPMGIPLKKLVMEIGGGIPGDKKLKAVQTGGPAGGCIPEALLDIPLDFEKLTEAGSMMGSGGMIVMDETTCMVDVARYFLSFTQDESCGKCNPCREGSRQMLLLLEEITRGQGRPEHIQLIEEIAASMQDGALCALGKLAPNPVLTTLQYFSDEYMAHIEEKKCPAGVCKELISYIIDPETCTGCGRCKKACPVRAIEGQPEATHGIDQSLCTRCGACLDDCRFQAISVL